MRKQMKRKEGLVERFVKWIKRFSKRKLVRNKVFALISLIIGYLSIPVYEGIGVCILYVLAAAMFFFLREDFIKLVFDEEV